MNAKIKEIRRTITIINNPYPDDHLIMSYKDFLAIRDLLPYYQFNSKVFELLLDVTLELWRSAKRINRLSLIEILKRYGSKNEGAINTLDYKIKEKVFRLFRFSFEDTTHINKNHLNEIRRLCNLMVVNVSFGPSEESWLCSNVEHSNIILNRVLRYPIKSAVISKWAREYYLDNAFRFRKTEITSGIIDEIPC
jgi:hypothetical protein